MSNKQKALLFLILGSLFAAGAGAASKIGLREVPPVSFVFFRFTLASFCILPFVLMAKKNMLRQIIALAPLSLLVTVNVILFVFGIKLTTATMGALLYAGTPLIVGFMGYIFYKDKLSFRESIGIIIGFIGIVIVVFLPILEQGKPFSGNLLGNMLIAIGMITYAAYLVFSQKSQQKNSPFVLIAAFILITTVVLFPFSVFELQSYPVWWEKVSITGITTIVYIAVSVTIFSYLANQYAIKHGAAIYASLTFYLSPVFAYLAAFLLLGEQLTTGIVIGAAIALFGIFLTTKE